ncbi:aldo/keto reductase [Mucilaginibacter conchicola]|uniref:Aldo/keto reductase n=1 Tax=Mucilaginibacter conchicola TaxID=2303333 RepID=A0A372NQT0_9SPHI|nr:aldo/keto reductase [Mucilaginibacter conchicola]RFZ90623.1 aldo/keto reductase [Mucilaginibacter conchicola]
MNYKIFGSRSGLRVSELALGAGTFGTRWGYGAQPDEAKKIFDRYIDLGGNFIDTADGYQFGESEELLGQMIGDKRNQIVLGTKYTGGGKELLTTGNSRKNMVQSVEASLKRLKTDYIDVYWVHHSDGQTPTEEIMRGLDDLVRAGKIVYGAFSNFPAWRIANASLMADLKNFAPLIAIQIEYNLIERSADRELLPMAEAHGLGVAFWSPVAGGSLTGKYRNQANQQNTRKQEWNGFLLKDETGERETAILDTLEQIAGDVNAKVGHVALAWLRQKHQHTSLSTVTILGAKNVQQLDDNVASLNVKLTDEQMERLNQVSQIALGSPHQMIAETQAKMLFGAASGLVELKHPVA